MPTLKNCAADLATVLTGNTIGGLALVSGQNLFSKRLHPIPFSTAVFLLNSGGEPPQPYLQTTRKAFYNGRVQILVYSGPGVNQFDAGETLARGLAGYLHQLTTVSGYVAIYVRESSPNYLGEDKETQRHMWSLNVDAQYTAT